MTTLNRFICLGAFAIAAVALVPAMSAAQTSSTFGVKAGLTSATVSLEDNDNADTSRLLGATGGVFIGKNLNDTLALQIEGLFSQRGVKDNSGSAETTFRLGYFDVPVLARFGNTTGGDTHFHAFTGPQFSVLLSAKESTEGISGSFDFKDELKSTEFGWTFGAGVEKGNVSVDARYTHGLTNIDDSDSDGPAKNRTFAVMVGLRLK